MKTLDPQATAAQLAALAHAPDARVRAGVAAHPNTPAEVLGRLGAEFPAEVLGNPALPLLRLAHPGLLAHWPVKTIETLAGQPGAPLWILHFAARHTLIDVQLAVVSQPELPADLLALLAQSPYWTIREYVARKPRLSPELLDLLSRDTDYGVRITLAGRADLPPQARQRLSQDPHALVRAVVRLSAPDGAEQGTANT